MTVIPAIDLRRGQCVRLLQGDFDRETVYPQEPAEIAQRYRAAGLRRLHVVDLDGARSGAQRQQAVVEALIGTTDLEVQLGGGIRDGKTLDAWLRAGVARCVVGSMAVTSPETVAGWLAEFGADAVVLALDVRTGADDEPRLATQGWSRRSKTSLWEALGFYAEAGARHVLCTDVARDGAMSGPNAGLYAELTRRFPDILLQGSGGVRDLADLAALRNAGCAAAITGRALLDSALSPEEVVRFLHGA